MAGKPLQSRDQGDRPEGAPYPGRVSDAALPEPGSTVPTSLPTPRPDDPTLVAPATDEPTPVEPPSADRRPHERTHHGHTFVDHYEWLRAKDDPEVVAHLEAENAWTRAQVAHLAPLRRAVFTEIKDRTLETDLSVPTRQGGYWYYSRTLEGSQYPLHARVPVTDPADWTPPALEPGEPPAGEQVVLDENAEAAGTSSSPWARSRCRATGACWCTPSTPRATSATRCGCATWRRARTCPTRCRARSRAPS